MRSLLLRTCLVLHLENERTNKQTDKTCSSLDKQILPFHQTQENGMHLQ